MHPDSLKGDARYNEVHNRRVLLCFAFRTATLSGKSPGVPQLVFAL